MTLLETKFDVVKTSEMQQTKVLIVEDEEIIGLHLCKLIMKLGYSVVAISNNGASALENYHKHQPDIMLVDISLKGNMNGIQLVSKIKETEDLPVIYLSSNSDEECLRLAQDTFPNAFLRKPFDEHQIATTLKFSLIRFNKQKELYEKLLQRTDSQEINIKELSETNAHLITATWRERELKQELQKTKAIIETQNRKILDSINYAKRIQGSIAPDKEKLCETLQKHFLFYKPKDVVSGDFPWLYVREDYIYFGAVDCTGHGVPGAMMSMIGNLLLNDVVNNEAKIKTPSEVLTMLHQGVVKTLKQDAPGNKASDGMDIALCRLRNDRKELLFSGAHLPLFHFSKKNGLVTYKGSRFPVGGVQHRNKNFYEDHKIEVQKGDKIFIFSDGIIDQLGGHDNRKWMTVGLQQFIIDNAILEMSEFGKKIELEFTKYMGSNKQVDDVILFGIEI